MRIFALLLVAVLAFSPAAYADDGGDSGDAGGDSGGDSAGSSPTAVYSFTQYTD